MPAEVGWIIHRCAADPTSGSLRGVDLTTICLHIPPFFEGQIAVRTSLIVPSAGSVPTDKQDVHTSCPVALAMAGVTL
jgi:hypothetical protein